MSSQDEAGSDDSFEIEELSSSDSEAGEANNDEIDDTSAADLPYCLESESGLAELGCPCWCCCACLDQLKPLEVAPPCRLTYMVQ